MNTIDDTLPMTEAPPTAPVDYYRSQAAKCRQAADAPSISPIVRDTYLDLARQWEELSQEMGEAR
jgi:hypothetical protein